MRLTLWIVSGAALSAGLLVLAFWKLVPADAELVDRIRAQVEARLGVEVTIGSAQLRLWPRAELVIEDAATVQPQPIRIRRLVAQASLMPLLRGRMELDDVQVEGAVLPQLSLRALRMRPEQKEQSVNAVQVALLSFRDVVWITRYGTPLEFSGSASFGPGWQLRRAEVVRPGVRPVARLALTPAGGQRWKVELQVGGGTANGELRLATAADGLMTLGGELTPSNIEVASMLAGFKRHSALNGKASGQTQLSASGHAIGDLARSLNTRTTFSVASARLLHLDIDKAIRSFGKDRDGETALLSLSGEMETQNTAEGMVVRYSALQARGETFSATGHGTIARRRIDGQMTVDLAGGLVGVPLTIAGPLSQPQVNVSASASTGPPFLQNIDSHPTRRMR